MTYTREASISSLKCLGGHFFPPTVLLMNCHAMSFCGVGVL